MESPVDRAENAARVPLKPVRVGKTNESAKEKDDKFSKVLREKMKEEQKKKRKRKNKKDELLLAKNSEESAAPTKTVDADIESNESEENSSQSESQDERDVRSIDLKA